MIVSQVLLDDVIAHARAEYDAECCGMIAYASHPSGVDSGASPGADGQAVAMRVRRAINTFANPGGHSPSTGTGGHSPSARIPGLASKRFEIDGREVLHALNEFEDAGLDLGAIYHSHTHTEPYPSQTDINFAANWPGLEWVIVGLAGEEPEVRCYLIEDGRVREVELRVT
jgi:[CysO sulfur-carrier protein]-S-L-cysteine hydrolase